MHVRGRKPPSVAGFTVLTVGEAKGTAKLQKEHPIGHSRTTPAVVSINLRRPVGIVSAFASLPRCWFKMKCSPNGGLMKTLSAMFLACALLSPAFAANDVKEEERVKESGEVLKEILDIPDNIPQDLLDKAESATDVVMKAEILSYSRSKGLFAGVSLEGSTLRSDGSANEKLYGQKLSAKDIIRDRKVKAPPAAQELISLLNKKTPKNLSD